ncbi:hypothetical protein [Streptomyces sp. NPDC060198]
MFGFFCLAAVCLALAGLRAVAPHAVRATAATAAFIITLAVLITAIPR